MPGGGKKMTKRQNDKKMGGLVRASRGEKSEGLNTFLGYFCCRLIMPVIFLVDTNYFLLLAYY
jgi:hypothetical protein